MRHLSTLAWFGSMAALGVAFYLWLIAVSGPAALSAYQCDTMSKKWQSPGCVAIEGVK